MVTNDVLTMVASTPVRKRGKASLMEIFINLVQILIDLKIEFLYPAIPRYNRIPCNAPSHRMVTFGSLASFTAMGANWSETKCPTIDSEEWHRRISSYKADRVLLISHR